MESIVVDLSRRVERLEQEVEILRELHGTPSEHRRPLTLAEQGRLMTERARRNAAYESRRLGEILDEMGIPSDPTITREKAQQTYLEAGFDPEANEFAQGIIAMREE